MSFRRTPDGIPEEIPSTSIKKTEGHQNKDELKVEINMGDAATEPTKEPVPEPFKEKQPLPNKRGASIMPRSLEELPTEPPAKKTEPSQSLPNQESIDDSGTTIWSASSKAASTEKQAAILPVDGDPMQDPISGWLVVTEGPGKGHFLKLGYGQNSIGRDESQRVSLNFGDRQISRTNHTCVTYDPRGNRFYISKGSDAKNLTYILGADIPVLDTQVLEPYTHIVLGDTTLRFVPFCIDGFTWENTGENA